MTEPLDIHAESPFAVPRAAHDLPAPGDAAPVALIGEGPEADEAAGALDARGTAVRRAPELILDLLGQVGVVGFCGPSFRHVFTCLAAGRVAVLLRPPADWGLMAGIDHLRAESALELAALADAAATHPHAFTALRAWGRIAAAPHHAERRYARLASA